MDTVLRGATVVDGTGGPTEWADVAPAGDRIVAVGDVDPPPRARIRDLAADLVAFDPATVAPEPPERVHDLPAGADRPIARACGIETVWVNATPVLEAGELVGGVAPGVVLRGQGA